MPVSAPELPDEGPILAERPRRHYGRLALRLAFLVLVLLFGAFALHDRYAAVRAGLRRLSLPTLFGGLVLAEASIMLSMLSWRRLLRDLGSSLPLSASCRVFFVGQLGKYLPGSVWPVLAQMELARDHAVPRARAAVAALVAIGVGVIGALVDAGALLPFAVSRTSWRVLVVLGLVASLVVASPPVLNRLITLGLRLLRRPPLTEPLSGRGLAESVAVAALSWLLQGLAVYVLAVPLLTPGGSHAHLLVLTVGSYAIASALGVLVIIAPAGIGVREPVLLAAITSELTTANALVVALVIRLLVTVADLGTGAVLALLPVLHRSRATTAALWGRNGRSG